MTVSALHLHTFHQRPTLHVHVPLVSWRATTTTKEFAISDSADIENQQAFAHGAKRTSWRAQEKALAASTVIALVLCVVFVVCFKAIYLGIAPEGSSDDEPVWYNETAQREYDELAEALLSGSVKLPEEPPEWLAEMDNPYDTNARDQMEAETGEPYQWDFAYYDGSYYVYFGIVPCLVFYVPFHLATGGALLPTGVPVLICAMLFIVGVALCVGAIARARFSRAPTWSVTLVFWGILLCSGLIISLMYPSLYQIPAVMSLALAVWALYFWWRACATDKVRFVLVGAICAALIIGCRPPIAIVALFALFPLVKLGRQHGKALRTWVALLVPFIVVGVGVCVYNYARFGSPLDFGATYNLTAVDLTARHFKSSLIGLGLYYYLLQPPILQFNPLQLVPTDLGAAYEAGCYVEAMPGGIFLCMPFLFGVLALLVPSVRAHQNKIALAALFAVVCGVVLVVFDVEFGGVLARYQGDFEFLFALAAGIGWMAWSARARTGRVMLAVFVALALAFNALFAFTFVI